MNFILFFTYAYYAFSFVNPITLIRHTHIAFTVEDIIDENETDWKKKIVIKYNSTNNNNPNPTPKIIKTIPMNILGCDMRYSYKEDNEKEVEKIRILYNKLQQIQFLENNNIGVYDKLQMIEEYSSVKNLNKKRESLDESDSALFENIKRQFTRKGEITEMWWFYDW
jgi:hypothetical protein